MSENVLAPHNRTVRFYGAGGAGINLVRARMEDRKLSKGQRAVELYSLIDTSLSNLHNADNEMTYTFRGVDGSGGNPATNAARIKEQLPDLLDKNPPADTNIIVCSNGGGTGPAVLPTLAGHLLNEGHTVIVVMVGMGPDETLRTIRNGLITFKNLELKVEEAQRPLAMLYCELDPTKSLSINNVIPLFVMDMLSILCSGHNPRIDKADIDHMFDYHKVTSQVPALSLLNVTLKEDDLRSQKNVTSYLALMSDDDKPAPRIQADYGKHGLLAPEAEMKNDVYFTVQANIEPIYDRLMEMEKAAASRKTVKVEKTRLSSGKESVDDASGLLFD